jgi:ribosomal protein S18 acetylase RimI-like enzyme
VTAFRIVDVVDADSFGRIPPCADPGFDHRTCDYWEDADRGSKAARLSWLEPVKQAAASGAPPLTENPFAPPTREPAFNPFAPAGGRGRAPNPFADDDDGDEPLANPFAPHPPARPSVDPGGPRKLGLLGRGLGVFGSYAKVLLADGEPAAYCQFGPLSAYPRAQRLRDLYPQLPDAPLPAVITCIATTPAARNEGLAARLVAATCDDLAARGFAAVEAYPERGVREDATSAAMPAFWVAAGFAVVVDDERYPVVRRELG